MIDQLALMLMFCPLIADTFLTVIRRSVAGHHPFVPHCDFYYQRMILAGMPQWKVRGLHWIAVMLWGALGYVLSLN